MITKYCQLYLLMKQKHDLLLYLYSYDLDNIGLQVEMLKTEYNMKECRLKMREVLRRE